MNTRSSIDLPGGSGSLGFVRGEVVTDMHKLKVGDLLVNDCQRFNATNVIKIVALEHKPFARGEIVTWSFYGRPDSARQFSLWHWELNGGDYRVAQRLTN